MSGMIFWGEKGEYGPFTVQEDGWPHAGEVVRYYRKKRKMSAVRLAQLYSEAIGTPVTARWMQKMEQQNQVPTDIMRRRALIKILNIPPILLGLASLEQVNSVHEEEIKTISAVSILKSTSSVDNVKYERDIRTRWLLSYTGEESLEEVLFNIWELEELERQVSGALQKQVEKSLNGYYQLASDITRHRGDFGSASFYANNAVRVTKQINVNDLFAAALYRRGYTYLEWGIFGDKTLQLIMNPLPDRKKIEAAIVDFELALPHAHAQLKGAIWLELSRAQGIMKNNVISLNFAEKAGELVESGTHRNDPLEQILLNGALNGLNSNMYLIGKAAALITLGRTTTALEILDDLSERGQGIASNQVRRLAYIQILRAEAFFGARDYNSSLISAIDAFKTFRDIGTLERIAWVNLLYQRIQERQEKYPELKELGKFLLDHKKSVMRLKVDVNTNSL